MVQSVKNKCPRCGSDHVVHHGTTNTIKHGKRRRYKCQECPHTFYVENNKENEVE